MKQAKYLVWALLAVALVGFANPESVAGSVPTRSGPSAKAVNPVTNSNPGGGRSAARTSGPTDSIPTVSVTAPNGGESWRAGTVQNVTWSSAHSTTDSISYSTDNGGSWLFVAKQTPPTQTFAWTVPNTPSPNCLVKVSAIDTATSEDVSDAVFTIARSDTGWKNEPSVPDGPRHKTVKAGGCVAADQGTGNLYLLKGNGTCEFYRYDAGSGVWYTGDSIPAVDPYGRKQTVKKGASLTVAGGMAFALKGDKSTELWRYNPGAVDGGWSAVSTLPILKSATQASDGTNYIYRLGWDNNSKTAVFTRYNSSGVPQSLPAPVPHTPGASKTFKTGACIVYYPDDKLSGQPRIFALQFTTNDFYSYDIAGKIWTWLNSMPLEWPGVNGKKKAGAGAGMAYAAVDRIVYALTGHNTLCLWKYDGATWTPRDPAVPPGPQGKKVKDGGGIAYTLGSLFVVKGGGTSECYSMALSLGADRDRTPGAGSQSAGSNRGPALGLAVAPNPVARDARVSFTLPRAANAELKLYDIAGKLVSTLACGYHAAGNHAYRLSSAAYRLSAGVYLLELETEGQTLTSRLVVE